MLPVRFEQLVSSRPGAGVSLSRALGIALLALAAQAAAAAPTADAATPPPARDGDGDEGPAPGDETEAERLTRLVRELGSNDFETRERAERDLVALGSAAAPALEEAATSSRDAEVRSRARRALAAIQGPGDRPGGATHGAEPPQPQEPPAIRIFPSEPNPEMEREVERILQEMLRRFQEGLRVGPGSEDGSERESESEGDNRDPGELGVVRGRWQILRAAPTGLEASLGLRVARVPAALREHLELARGDGVLITAVEEGGLAERIGLRLHDVVISVNDRPARSIDDLAPLADPEAVSLVVVRHAQRMTLDLPAGVRQEPEAGGGEEQQPAPPRQRRF